MDVLRREKEDVKLACRHIYETEITKDEEKWNIANLTGGIIASDDDIATSISVKTRRNYFEPMNEGWLRTETPYLSIRREKRTMFIRIHYRGIQKKLDLEEFGRMREKCQKREDQPLDDLYNAIREGGRRESDARRIVK